MESVLQELYFKVAETDYEIQNCFKLRYQVYCEEKKWLPTENYPDGKEIDDYDEGAIHIQVLDEEFRLVGTMRILRDENYSKLPYESHPGLKKDLPIPGNVAELSRLIVSAKTNRFNVTRGLLRATYQVSKELGIDNWIFVVEPSLVRLLARFKFFLDPLGLPAKYFGGFTMASVCNIAHCEKNWKKESTEAWQYYQTSSIRQTASI